MRQEKLKYHFEVDRLNDPRSYDTVDLFQIGVAHCDVGTTVGYHTHADYYELTVVTAGRGSVTTNDVTRAVEKDDIYLSLPHDRHRMDSDPDAGMNYYFFAFRVTDAELSKQMRKLESSIGSEEKRIFRNDTLKQLIASAVGEIDSPRLYKNRYLSALFTQAVIQILRSHVKHTIKNRHTNTKNELCYQIMSYIDANLYTMTGLSELASALNYDYAYLSRVFAETTSGTISDYYREARLERARMLIRGGELNFTQISEKLHYASIYSFSKAFKEKYHLSPREYRRSLTEKKE